MENLPNGIKMITKKNFFIYPPRADALNGIKIEIKRGKDTRLYVYRS